MVQSNKQEKKIIKKSKMKKMSKFYLSKQMRLKDMVSQLQKIALNDQLNKVKKVVSQRKQKWKQSAIGTQLKLPNFKLLRKQYMEFSSLPCNASLQPFITQKQKKKLASSDRAYSSTPNFKNGSASTSSIINKSIDAYDSRVLGQMFAEYERKVNEQNKGQKIKVLKQLSQNISLPQFPQKKNNSNTDKSCFQQSSTYKFTIDKNEYHTLTQSLTPRCVTDRTNNKSRLSQDSLILCDSTNKSFTNRITLIKPKIFQSDKLKRLNSTLDSKTNHQEKILEASINVEKKINSHITGIKKGSRQIQTKKESKCHLTTHKLNQSRRNLLKNLNSAEFS